MSQNSSPERRKKEAMHYKFQPEYFDTATCVLEWWEKKNMRHAK